MRRIYRLAPYCIYVAGVVVAVAVAVPSNLGILILVGFDVVLSTLQVPYTLNSLVLLRCALFACKHKIDDIRFSITISRHFITKH